MDFVVEEVKDSSGSLEVMITSEISNVVNQTEAMTVFPWEQAEMVSGRETSALKGKTSCARCAIGAGTTAISSMTEQDLPGFVNKD